MVTPSRRVRRGAKPLKEAAPPDPWHLLGRRRSLSPNPKPRTLEFPTKKKQETQSRTLGFQVCLGLGDLDLSFFVAAFWPERPEGPNKPGYLGLGMRMSRIEL